MALASIMLLRNAGLRYFSASTDMPAWSAARATGIERDISVCTRCCSSASVGRLTLKRSGSRTTQAIPSSLVRCSRVTLRTGQWGMAGCSAGLPCVRTILRIANSPAL